MSHTADGPTVIRPSPDPETLLQLRLGTYPEPWPDEAWPDDEDDADGDEGRVIGHRGIAIMCGFRTRNGDPAENTVRGLASTDRRFPRPLWRTGPRVNIVLYPLAEVRTWAIEAGCLEPDGVTPRRRKAHRGPGRAKRGSSR